MSRLTSRPNWFTPDLKHKLPLHNNVCYDTLTHKKVSELLSNFDPVRLGVYTNGYDLYNILSNYYQVNIKNMAIGIGATDIINRIIYLNRNETIILLTPTFEMVKVYCDMYHVHHVEYMYYNFDEFDIGNLPADSVVYIANPNGINGHVFDQDEVKYILKKSKLLILDEAYIDYASQPSLIEYESDYDNAVVIRTFSKSLNIPGARCGFCIGSENLISSIQSIRLNSITNELTTYLISNLISDLNSIVDRMNVTKTYLEQKYNLKHSNGNYCLFKEMSDKLEFCLYKSINDTYDRVALADLDIFKDNLL